MTINAVEFYCGIGGLHTALSRSTVAASVVAAYDWDPTACAVYEANHGSGIAKRTDISRLDAATVAKHNAQLWLLSPSCQPYTVLNPNAKGADDPRALSFLHLVRNVLPELHERFPDQAPKWLLVENVAGFEASTTRDTVLEMLSHLGYRVEEFLLTPLLFGIPNSRLRYYLLATLGSTSNVSIPSRDTIKRYIPDDVQPWTDPRTPSEGENVGNINPRPILEYLDNPIATEQPSSTVEGDQLWHPYAIPPKILGRWGQLLDIVKPSSSRTCCFTRGYTKLVEGSGSILQMEEVLDTTIMFNRFAETQDMSNLDALRLRYFTPSELLRLFYFTPPSDTSSSFRWPDSVSRKTKYKLIGNSVNVEVVKHLIEYLVKTGDQEH